MDDIKEETDRLQKLNGDTLGRITRAGKVVNGLSDHWMIIMLEHLCEPETAWLRLQHEKWCADYLGKVESNIAREKLTGGFGGSNNGAR